MTVQKIFILISSQIVAILIGALVFSWSNNSLSNNTNWISTKTTLERGVMGANEFVKSGKALGQGSLNLGAWFGYQEIYSVKDFTPSTVDLKFKLKPRAYIYLLLKDDKGISTGVRLSANPLFRNALIEVAPSGKYLEKHYLHFKMIAPDIWHKLKLDVSGQTVALSINGQSIASFNVRNSPLKLGFRGSRQDSFISNLKVSAQHTPLFEAFDGVRINKKGALLSLSIFWLIFFIFFLLFRHQFSKGNFIFAAQSFSIVFAICFAAVFGYQYVFLSQSYPLVLIDYTNEEAFKNSQKHKVEKLLRQNYLKKSEGTYRVAFIGSSQTWGAGAQKIGDVFVRKIEQKLNEQKPLGPKVAFECLNMGVSALSSGSLINQLYIPNWNLFKPDMVVVNLGNNDKNPQFFRKNLIKLAKKSALDNTTLLFVLEANSIERDIQKLKNNHQVMRQVAKHFGIRTVDLHRELLNRYDNGFLWWDEVHLTTYGHELATQILFKDLKKVITQNRVEPKPTNAKVMH